MISLFPIANYNLVLFVCLFVCFGKAADLIQELGDSNHRKRLKKSDQTTDPGTIRAPMKRHTIVLVYVNDIILLDPDLYLAAIEEVSDD
jgi:hypothetical protein